MPTQTMPRVPVSWGELLDKITILEIKQVRIQVELALINVKKELAYLQNIVDQQASIDQVIGELRLSLKSINEKLWDIEDAIRVKEDKQEFDQEFIEFARSVYKLNDKRAQIKKLINIELGSEIIEEKSYKGLN
ncbi:MAG: DUF6165 family protein [Methylobacter sp.]